MKVVRGLAVQVVDKSCHHGGHGLKLGPAVEKELDREKLKIAAQKGGLNQSDIAERLGVSRASVSKWFNGQSFPRPAELLKLGRLLGLQHDELVPLPWPSNQAVVALAPGESPSTRLRS